MILFLALQMQADHLSIALLFVSSGIKGIKIDKNEEDLLYNENMFYCRWK